MKWFSDLKTATKIAFGAAALLALLVTVAVLGLSTAATANDGLETTFKRDFVGNDLVRRAQIDVLTIGRHFRAAMLETDESRRAAAIEHVDEADAKLRRELEDIQGLVIRPESKARVAEMQRLEPEYVAKCHEAIRLSKTDMPAALVAHAASGDMGAQLSNLLAAVAASKGEIAQATFDDSKARYATARGVILAATLLAVIGGALLAFFVGRSIASPLAVAVGVLNRVSQGDLAARLDLDRKDEVGALALALNRSLETICSTLQGVTTVSFEVSAASAQLAESASQISGGAQAQAASLEETAASLEEISSTVKQNTDNAQEASQLASDARDTAERGSRVVANAVAAMTAITTSSRKIADIITTIDEIAFQTNLLALNAAVEAARAGEQGRGFGVVASEVRSLAQRTGTAAKEIRGLIADSSSKVELGVEQVNESGKTLDAIVKSVKRVTDMVAEIAAASREQNTGLDQVNTAVSQVDQVTQSNAAQTEELSATATSLSDKSMQLQELVAVFELGGATSRDTGTPRASSTPRKRPAAKGSNVVRLRKATPPPLPVTPARKTANGFEEF